ncbi:UvrY/SirA/GacA family response regulator transcription factor [Ravibacter arvi]|uniref:UvrY/SirA/GacA family response regulator transcription factor n=2 Tax=Ravibacter arvi TaxID=2051041 RepID=A0ABP8MBE0_9BACT
MRMNVMIIANSPLQRFGLSKLITERFEDVLVESAEELYGSGKDEVGAAREIVILCLYPSSPLRENLEKLEAVSGRYPAARILVMENTAEKESFENLQAYLNSGISGFLTTASPLDMFDDCLRKLMAGQKYLSPHALEWLLDTAFLNKEVHKLTLTSRESYVARQLAEGLTVSQIAKETNRKVSTISTIKRNVFRKTNTDNIIKLRELVLNAGIRGA